jgi:hypothetical protein
MGICCGAKAVFENGTTAFRPVMAESMPNGPAERVIYRFAADMMPVQQGTNGPRFDFNDGFGAALVATFAPNFGTDVHLERSADASIDFGDVSMRAFAFLTFRPALQDSQLTNVSDLGEPVGGESA